MALHGDNESGGEADGRQDVSPMAQMTSELQRAYVKAGEDMGKQMAAAIVAIITQMTAGQGQPLVFGWPEKMLPDPVREVIPEEKLREASWVVIVAPELTELPLMKGDPLWFGDLASGHRLVVLA